MSSQHIAPSVGLRPGPRIDLDRGRHSRRQRHALRHFIDVDAHGYALGKAHPSEDRIDRGNPLLIGLRVGDVDRAREAVDMAANDLAKAATIINDIGAT